MRIVDNVPLYVTQRIGIAYVHNDAFVVSGQTESIRTHIMIDSNIYLI
jgi:hypothetical protein